MPGSALDRKVVGPSLVRIFWEASAETVATATPDRSMHLWADTSLREACELLWGTDEMVQKAHALKLSLVYPGQEPCTYALAPRITRTRHTPLCGGVQHVRSTLCVVRRLCAVCRPTRCAHAEATRVRGEVTQGSR